MVGSSIKAVSADRKTREAMIGGLLLDYGFLTRDTIGESRCSRPIDLLCIGNRKKQVLFSAAYHGMEWITTLIMLRFVDELCFSVMTGKAISEVYEIHAEVAEINNRKTVIIG